MPASILSRTIRVLLVACAAAAVIGWAQSPAEGLYGYDGYFHIKYADWIAGHGLSREFPWWGETFLRDRYADKDLLFHLLLIPFTFGDLLSGGKAASILFGSILYAAIAASLAALRVRAPAFWALALLLTSTTLLYRAGLVRSHVLAIGMAMLGIAAILRGSRAGIAAASAAYALTHIGWHLLPCIALLHDGVRTVMERKARFEATLASLGGTAAAVALNPYMPNHLKLWWVQNVEVLAMAWSPSAPDLSLGREFLPGSPWHLLYYNPGPALMTVAGLALTAAIPVREARAGRPPGRPATEDAGLVTLGLLAVGLLGLSFASRRFVEFWAPLSAILAGAAATRFWPARAPRAASVVCALAILALSYHTVGQTRRIIGEDRGLIYRACGEWIDRNVPEEDIVFTTDWDEFPQLFLLAPGQRYLVGLDPTFMYVTSPSRWRLWRDVVEGRTADLRAPIRDVFGARHVFADAGREVFIERADHHPLFRLEHGDFDCSVYTLREPREAGPESDARFVAWSIEGRPEREAGAPLDFVDVAVLRGEPAGADECASVLGRLDSPRAGPAAFAISSDDEVRVAVSGGTVFDSRSATAPSLDEALAQHASGGRRPLERIFRGDLAAGYNEVTISTCRKGAVWGFHLRVIEAP